jgi:hypothetical protein
MSTAPDELLEAMAALDAAGGRMRVVDGRLRVEVDLELPDSVWEVFKSHRDHLVAMLAGDRPIWPEAGPPIWRDRPGDLELLPAPDGVDRCDRCRSTETVEQTIHGGRSVRLDCAACGRFRKFVVWNGDPMP